MERQGESFPFTVYQCSRSRRALRLAVLALLVASTGCSSFWGGRKENRPEASVAVAPAADVPRSTPARNDAATPVLTLAALQEPAPEARQALLDGCKHLIFAQTYRVTDRDGRPDELVLLGHYDFVNEREVMLNFWSFDGRKNTRPGTTDVQHPRMMSEPGKENAMPGMIHVPGYTGFEQVKGTWTNDGREVRIRIGDALHRWTLQDREDRSYVLAGSFVNARDGTNTIDGLGYSNGCGYAYLADEVRLQKRITRDDLFPVYKGEFYTRKEEGQYLLRWTNEATSLSVRAFKTIGDGGGDVLGFVRMDTKMNPPMATHSTLLLNEFPYSSQLLALNHGHDFNRNGVFDELGHTVEMFGVVEKGKVQRMVFIEYSFQNSGRPLLGVGRYFVPKEAPVADKDAGAAPAVPGR
jgi:hypothetical protein